MMALSLRRCVIKIMLLKSQCTVWICCSYYVNLLQAYLLVSIRLYAKLHHTYTAEPRPGHDCILLFIMLFLLQIIHYITCREKCTVSGIRHYPMKYKLHVAVYRSFIRLSDLRLLTTQVLSHAE